MTERRFERQVRFAALGEHGQKRLLQSKVLVVGTGALGGAAAQLLCRSGVGTLVLVDRDVVDETNLPRQVLFDAKHAEEGTPKVEAAAESLRRGGGPTQLELHSTHLDADNIAEIAAGCDLIVDGTDNMQTRYLVNDYCVDRGVPWIYGGVVGSGGLTLAVLPGQGPCLRCVFRDPPPPGTLPTCDTAGVIAPAVAAVAAMQSGLALRQLALPGTLEPGLCELDAWSGEVRRLGAARDPECPCCAGGERSWLESPMTGQAVSLCGRNTVQVRGTAKVDLDRLAEQLASVTEGLTRVGPLLRFHAEDVRVTVFPDGRALLEGVDDPDRGLALYDRYLGS